MTTLEFNLMICKRIIADYWGLCQ